MGFIILPESHVDHGLTEAHLDFLREYFELNPQKSVIFIDTIDLPERLAPLDCGLYGPIMGDEPVGEDVVTYMVRGNRKCASRMVNLPKRKTRKLVFICGPSGDKPCVLYTAYGGPLAPREPGDLSIGSWEEVLASRKFWAEHALAYE